MSKLSLWLIIIALLMVGVHITGVIGYFAYHLYVWGYWYYSSVLLNIWLLGFSLLLFKLSA